MVGAEVRYAAMEATLQNEIDSYETLHSGYDECNYGLAEIWHEPLCTDLHSGGVERRRVNAGRGAGHALPAVKQYQLTQTVDVSVRYRTETGAWTETDPETGETITCTGTYGIPYNYTICNVTLNNENLSHLPVYIISENQTSIPKRRKA